MLSKTSNSSIFTSSNVVDNLTTNVPQSASPQYSVLNTMWIAAAAGMGGITAVYPVDVIKTRMQYTSSSKSALQLFKDVASKEGVSSLYKGLGPQLCGTIPDKAVSLATREFVKGRFQDPDTFLASFSSAAISGMTQSVVMNPVEIVKVRMQLDSKSEAVKILRQVPIRGLYRGYSACFCRDVTFAVSYFCLYDLAKRQLSSEQRQSMVSSIFAASIAGVPAAFISTPVDVIKTRMQSSGSEGGFLKTVRQLHAEGGVRQLFAGWGPRVGRIAPQFGIVLVTYDWLLQRYGS
ncbi:hypothetical protein ABG067_002780 [Albugo candida]|uniref:Uncharacterized protein n=1 Tax=Albugo candida TaxID=65357 RepID=A0A024GBJ5_9STRA|nr:unnamed protein product [Albugo candida]|eukprot:CCI44034.1 unnamed protein product [Albugo candida]